MPARFSDPRPEGQGQGPAAGGTARVRRKFGAKRRIAEGRCVPVAHVHRTTEPKARRLCLTEHSNPKGAPDGPSGPFGEHKGEGRGALPHTLPAFSEKAGEKDKTFGFVR